MADFAGLTTIEDMASRGLDATVGPLIPIGLSMGGVVAAEMIDRAPNRIPAAVLLDTNLDVPRPQQLEARRRWANQTRAGQFAAVVQEIMPSLTVDLSRGGAAASAMALDAGPGRFLNENQALINRRRDRRPSLARYRKPLLVVVGRHDRLCPPTLHEAIVKSSACGRLAVVPGAGHLSTIDQPEAVTHVLARWLAEVIRIRR